MSKLETKCKALNTTEKDIRASIVIPTSYVSVILEMKTSVTKNSDKVVKL